MIALSLGEVRDLTRGRLYGPGDTETEDGSARASETLGVTDHLGSTLVDGPVTTDSREIGPGGLFVARVGEHADGHDFVPAARAAGAVAALTSRRVAELPCVVVDDIEVAFGQVARAVIDRAPHLRVVAVTGSSGKTSTKDLLAAVLAGSGETVAPVNSLNGEIGVPLTVCRVTPSTRFLVVEMGARGIGHLRYLCDIAPPEVAIVLNVGTAHLGEFGSRENIALAKSELPQAVDANGLSILNADDPLVAAMATGLASRVTTVGLAADADVRAVDVVLDAWGRPSYTLVTVSGSRRVTLRQSGAHQVGNSLAVAAAALELGVALDDVTQRLSEARPTSRWRMEVTERPDGVTVVNDAYNANPESMRAALSALAAIHAGGRRWAVLGSMLELGPGSDDEHRAVAARASELHIDQVVAVGEGAKPMRAPLWLPDIDAAYEHLAAEVRPGDVVLVKSSRDSGLRWLGDRLATAGSGAATVTPAQVKEVGGR